MRLVREQRCLAGCPADPDLEKQAWLLRQVFDDGFCQTCECWRGLEEVEIDPIDSNNVTP